MREATLEALLVDLGASLDVPTVDLVPAVRSRLSAPTRTDARPASARTSGVRVAIVGLAAVLLLSVVFVASPGARQAVADWFGLRGVEFETGEIAASAGAELDLGRPTSLADATRRAGYDVLVPPVEQYGAPDAVFVDVIPGGHRVSLLYDVDDRLPATEVEGLGMIVTQFRANIDEPAIRKTIPPGVEVVDVSIDGEPGYWISGGPHTVTFAEDDGQTFADEARVAGDTLLWEDGPRTIRIESGLSQTEAISLAESMEPA